MFSFQGLGRRRLEKDSNKSHANLLVWMPQKKELDKKGADHSMYRLDFQGAPKSQPIIQKIIQRPKTSFDDNRSTTTSYRYWHGQDNPNRGTLSAMSNVGLTTQPNRRTRAKSVFGDGGSVASCLSWHQPQRPLGYSRSRVPAATALVPPPDVTPAPPSVPKVNSNPISYAPHPPSQPAPAAKPVAAAPAPAAKPVAVPAAPPAAAAPVTAAPPAPAPVVMAE